MFRTSSDVGHIMTGTGWGCTDLTKLVSSLTPYNKNMHFRRGYSFMLAQKLDETMNMIFKKKINAVPCCYQTISHVLN